MRPRRGWILPALFLLLAVVAVVSLRGFEWDQELDVPKVILEGAFFLLTLLIYLFVARLPYVVLELGWAIFTLYQFNSFLDELIEIQDTAIAGLYQVGPGIVGLTLVAIGFYRIYFQQQHKLRSLTKRASSYQNQAHQDALTGLMNRGGIVNQLRVSCREHVASERVLAVLFIDLDGFKAINDQFGHRTGDDVLRQVAERLNRTVRTGDFLARWGGDEFLVVLTDLEATRAAGLLAERIMEAIAKPVIVGNEEHNVGASIGISLCPENATKPEKLIELADHAMYEAKRTRADRSRSLQPLASPPVRPS